MVIKCDQAVADYSEILREAMLSCRDGETITLEKGVYPVSGEGSLRRAVYLSNNDFAQRIVALPVFGKKKVKICGNGATLLLTEHLSGIGIADSEDIEISDLTVDYAHNYHLEWEAEEIEGDCVRVKRREGFPFVLTDGKIATACGGVGRSLCMAFDKRTQAPCYRRRFLFVDFGGGDGCVSALPYEKEGQLWLKTAWARELHKGDVLVICYLRKRYQQSAFVTDSQNIAFRNVHICYSPSMGIMAQLSRNITLENVRVEPNGRHGMLSSVCDATHFVHCDGEVRMRRCRFFNMMDDAANIHGNYLRTRAYTDNAVTAEIMHFQQYGVNVFRAGDTLTVYKQDTADVRARFAVRESVLTDEKHLLLRVDGDASCIEEGDVLCNADRMPEVDIADVACGRNRPRGFLLNSPKKTGVRRCLFNNSEHGIELAGDTTYWYESGQCRDVTVEDCTFYNCNHADGDYAVMIRPAFNASGEQKRYHANVTVRRNKFYGFQCGMVSATHTDNLCVCDNVFERDNTYPARAVADGKLRIRECNVSAVRGNTSEEDLFALLSPVWRGHSVREQTAVFVGENDAAPLLYAPTGEVTVTDYARRITYTAGKDYAVRGKEILLLRGDIPYYTPEQFYRLTPDAVHVGVDEAKLAFADGKSRYFKFGNLSERAVRIGYACRRKEDFLQLNGAAGCCERFKNALRAGKAATVVFYGDSITEGANASAEMRIPPYTDAWPRMATQFLRRYYRNDALRYVNTASGGKDSAWGVANFDRNVTAHAPDLLVLAFGMNDGGKTPQEMGALTEQMLAKAKADLPNCEVLLIATSLPNPQSTWFGNQIRFAPVLRALAEKYGAALLDMTALTDALYGAGGRIRYRDFTDNNVNHPNDFGVRLYAQAFLNTLLGEEYRAFFDEYEKTEK